MSWLAKLLMIYATLLNRLTTEILLRTRVVVDQICAGNHHRYTKQASNFEPTDLSFGGYASSHLALYPQDHQERDSLGAVMQPLRQVCIHNAV